MGRTSGTKHEASYVLHYYYYYRCTSGSNFVLLSINISDPIKTSIDTIPNIIIGYRGLVDGSMFIIPAITPNNA
jgi:hypothetical protein